jgi:hypothetical protein
VGRPAPEPTAKPAPKPKPAPAPSLVRLPAWAAAKMAALEAEAPAHEPIPFIGRPALTCSQIIGDPKAQPSMCCGRPVHWRKVYGEMSASSYCEEHFKRNTVAIQPRAPGPAYDASVQRVTQTVLMQARAFG